MSLHLGEWSFEIKHLLSHHNKSNTLIKINKIKNPYQGHENGSLQLIFKMSPFFRTVEDVLQENQELKEENKWLHDVITNNISKLMEEGSLTF